MADVGDGRDVEDVVLDLEAGVSISKDLLESAGLDGSSLLVGEDAILLIPEAVSITAALVLRHDDVSQGAGEEGAREVVLSKETSEAIDLGDLAVEALELGGKSEVRGDQQEALNGVRLVLPPGVALALIVDVTLTILVVQLQELAAEVVIGGKTALATTDTIEGEEVDTATLGANEDDVADGISELSVNLLALSVQEAAEEVLLATEGEGERSGEGTTELTSIREGRSREARGAKDARRNREELGAVGRVEHDVVGDGRVAIAEGGDRELNSGGALSVALVALVPAEDVEVGRGGDNGEVLLGNDLLVLGNVEAAGVLEEIVVGPSGMGGSEGGGDPVVLAEEDSGHEGQTNVLVHATVTSGKDAGVGNSQSGDDGQTSDSLGGELVGEHEGDGAGEDSVGAGLELAASRVAHGSEVGVAVAVELRQVEPRGLVVDELRLNGAVLVELALAQDRTTDAEVVVGGGGVVEHVGGLEDREGIEIGLVVAGTSE